MARSNNTITIMFKNIREKTKGGYYLNPEVDPWAVFHPNKKKIPFHLNEKLRKKEFEKYKKYVLKRFRPPDVLKSLTCPDKEINDNKPYLNKNVFKTKAPLLFIESPTGSGKTTKIASWMKSTKDSVLFISVNRAQAVTTHRSLLKQGLDDFECYIASDKKDKEIKMDGVKYRSSFIKQIKDGYAPERLICGVLSLHHLLTDEEDLLGHYDLIVIDEITTLPRFAVGPVDLIGIHYERFSQDMLALTKLLRTAKKVICMDGYVSKPVINAISTISKKKPYLIRKNYSTNKKVEIYLTRKGNEPNLKGEITCKAYWKQLKKDLLKAKKNKTLIVMAFSFKKKAEEIAGFIEHTIPKSKKRIKLITGDTTKDEETLNIIRELDLYLDKKDICFLIYSPAITTGVDIAEAKNTNVYHVVSGKHLSSHTHYQMTMRGRQAASYKVLFPLHLARNTDTAPLPGTHIFNKGILNLMDNVPFRKQYEFTILKTALKQFNLMMGSLLIFKELETAYSINQTDIQKTHTFFSNLLPIRTILKYLKSNTVQDLISSEAVKTATTLEIACIEWDNYDKTYGVLGQYINLLAREGCLVSKQIDNLPSKKSKKQKAEIYVDKYLHVISEILNYKGNIPATSKTALANLINIIKTGQRILNLARNNYNSNLKTTATVNLLKPVFTRFHLTFKKCSTTLSNDQCIIIYDSLYHRKLSIDKTLELEIDKILKDGINISNKMKLARTMSLLKIFYIVDRKYKGDQQIIVRNNTKMLLSIRNMDEKHIRYLYT